MAGRGTPQPRETSKDAPPSPPPPRYRTPSCSCEGAALALVSPFRHSPPRVLLEESPPPHPVFPAQVLLEEQVEYADQTLKRNDFTLQIMAVVPALLLGFVMLTFLRALYQRVRTSSPRGPIEDIRCAAPRSHAPPPPNSALYPPPSLGHGCLQPTAYNPVPPTLKQPMASPNPWLTSPNTPPPHPQPAASS